MKIFLDTVDISAIQKWYKCGLIDGITTNPTLLSKAAIKDPREHLSTIVTLMPDADISIEVTETEPTMLYKQAHAIANLGANVVVKIPCHQDYYEVIHRLIKDGIRLNITLVFSLGQGLLMSKLGVTYISPFVGRLEEHDEDGRVLLDQLRTCIDRYGYKTQILAASLRSVEHVYGAWCASVDAVTVSPNIMEKITEHTLTDKGIEQFKKDWSSLGVKQFP